MKKKPNCTVYVTSSLPGAGKSTDAKIKSPWINYETIVLNKTGREWARSLNQALAKDKSEFAVVLDGRFIKKISNLDCLVRSLMDDPTLIIAKPKITDPKGVRPDPDILAIDKVNKRINLLTIPGYRQGYLPCHLFSSLIFAVRRRHFLKCGGFDESLGSPEEAVLDLGWRLMDLQCARVAYITEALFSSKTAFQDLAGDHQRAAAVLKRRLFSSNLETSPIINKMERTVRKIDKDALEIGKTVNKASFYIAQNAFNIAQYYLQTAKKQIRKSNSFPDLDQDLVVFEVELNKKMGRDAKACKLLMTALKKRGGKAKALVALADIYYGQGQYQKAIKLLKHISDDHEALYIKGLAYMNLGSYAAAIRELKQMDQLAPEFLEGKKALVQYHCLTGNLEAAGRYQEEVLHLDRNKRSAILVLINLYAQMKQYTEIKNIRINELDETTKIFVKSYYQYLVGQYNAAIGLLSKVIAADPGFAQAHKILADAYLALGDKKQAMMHYQQTLKIDPGYEAAGQKLRELSFDAAGKKGI